MKFKQNNRGFLVFVVIVLALGVLWAATLPTSATDNVSLSRVIEEARAGQVQRIDVDGQKLTVTLKKAGATKQIAYKDSATATLADYGIDMTKVDVSPKNPENNNDLWLNLAFFLMTPLLLVGLFFYMMRQAQSQGNQNMNFGKSRAKLYGADKNKVTFGDVAGTEEAKQELTEIVEFLKFPAKFEALGAKIPKGVLLFGPPGTGKTLLARAVAGEADVPFFSIAGSDFVEMFVGVGASRVRDLFAKAKKNAPCIIFIDEIDAVGRQRGAGMGGGHDEREQTLNQILVEMDGFEQGTNVIVMAATNRPDVLDPALLRPGRFDRRVTLDSPDLKSRHAILDVHVKNKPLAKDVDLEEIAKKTPGFSGADLENLANEAAILAARNDAKSINQHDMTASLEKVLMGPERKSHVMNPQEKEITAYHEAGHAIVAHMTAQSHPVNKVSIISRGRANGYTWQLDSKEATMQSVADFKDDLATLLGGRMAEQIMLGEITTGASNDLQKAARLARSMIVDYGMGSEKLQHLVFGSHSEVFLGRGLNEVREYSEETARLIDAEVGELVDEAAARAGAIIKKHRDKLGAIAAKLIKDEVIDKDEFAAIAGPRPEKPGHDDPRRQVNPAQDIAPGISNEPSDK
jgi:cell division protease FtsH